MKLRFSKFVDNPRFWARHQWVRGGWSYVWYEINSTEVWDAERRDWLRGCCET